jgi:hypothetical protein
MMGLLVLLRVGAIVAVSQRGIASSLYTLYSVFWSLVVAGECGFFPRFLGVMSEPVMDMLARQGKILREQEKREPKQMTIRAGSLSDGVLPKSRLCSRR